MRAPFLEIGLGLGSIVLALVRWETALLAIARAMGALGALLALAIARAMGALGARLALAGPGGAMGWDVTSRPLGPGNRTLRRRARRHANRVGCKQVRRMRRGLVWA